MKVTLTAAVLLCLTTGTALAAEARTIKKSDVVFMGAKTADIYKVYGATLVSWGGRPWGDNEKAIKSFEERVRTAHELGMRYCAGAAFRTAFAKMIDFDENFMDSVCRRLDGEPILVPWLWDHQHKGHPAYWFCTNSPGYRRYLKFQVKLAMCTDVEGLHIDDYNGTAGTEWRGGCFCKHCMAAFREYLRENVPRKKLKEYGIKSLDDFDYGKFLKAQGVTVDDYRRKVERTLPLGREFITFQYRSATAWVREIRKYAESLVGHPLMLSVNSSGSNHKALMIAPYLTFFSGEVHHGAEPDGRLKPYPIWSFKLADALGIAQVCTGSGGDWAYIAEHKKPGLVRTWIAQDYAFGHQLMAPHRQWAYTKTKGTHWYQSQPEDYAHIYRFVRRNADLFDGYEAVAKVALLYSNAAFRVYKRDAQKACYWLAEHNIPFHLVIAGDDWLDVKLTADKLSAYDALVVAPPDMLDGEQKKVLDDFAAKGKVVLYDAKKKCVDEEKLFSLVPRQIAVEGADGVMAVPRAIPGMADAPVVIHLLNRNYDPTKDAVTPQRDFKVVIRKSLFGRLNFKKATLYAPPQKFDPDNVGASEPVPLKLEVRGDSATITIPSLHLWGIIELEG